MPYNLFQLIDLDRTLFDTSRFVKALTDEIDITEPGVGTLLDEQYEQAYSNGETFFLLRTLRQERGDDWFESLVERVVAKVGAESFLLDGVRERLERADSLTNHSPSWGVLTYGDDIDQRMKMRIVGLQDTPVLVTQTPDKGELLQSWRQADGTFKLPEAFGGGVVDCLSLEDDKLRAFKNLPEHVRGFWVTTDTLNAQKRLADAQQAGVSKNVIPVSNLIEVIDYLNS